MAIKEETIKIILIGCGPHAKRIYLPALNHLNKVEISLVLELKGQEKELDVIRRQNSETDFWFIDPFENRLPPCLSEKLSDYVKLKNISGVIIATEPLVHIAYSEWALDNGLNILLDKPISTRRNVITSYSNAEGIYDDYLKLVEKYNELQDQKETAFVINSQRRFHGGFQFVRDQIREVKEKTGCPVTFIQAYHCDGQWRFPSEIVTQEYHPYCFGYGKASHSGYHIFDTVYQLYKASVVNEKVADKMEVVSSFIQPNGFFKQITEGDYQRIFGVSYDKVKRWSAEELEKLCRGFGEIDLSSLITLKKDGDAIANFTINLIHNGFSGRTWVYPGADLYKGNGRIKHESYHIQQGPFQNIQIHTYQGSDKHDANNELEEELGGKNHFDVFVFRNPLISNNARQPSTYKLSDLIDYSNNNHQSNITMELVKWRVVEEFVEYLKGNRRKDLLESQLEDHLVPVSIMSSIYRSNILRKLGKNNIVTSAFPYQNDQSYIYRSLHQTA